MKNRSSIAVAADGVPTMVAPATRGAIRRRLAAWFAGSRRDLPWRRTRDPYAIWVSEVMLQQTQVKTVEAYYQRFMKRFPDIARLARARRQTVLKAWEGLGYYARARNMHRSARIVTERMHGRLPATWDALHRLPGIGDYIAAAVLSIAHDEAYAVVDGNVKRVLSRLFCIDLPVNQSSAHKTFQALADRLLDRRRPGDHNQAMMELGALICTPLHPACPECPLSRFCRARRAGEVEAFPKRVGKAALPVRHSVAGAVIKDGRVLMVQRPEDGLLGGLWEFPGGRMPAEAHGPAACAQQIADQVGLCVDVKAKVAAIAHTYTHFKLRMDLYLCRWRGNAVRLKGPAGFKWVRPDRVLALPLHGAMHKALARLEKMPQSWWVE